MRRLTVITSLIFIMIGVYGVTGPSAAPTTPSTSANSPSYYLITWTSGQAPTITQSQGTPPATAAVPASESSCVWDLLPPSKENSTTIDEVATASCSADVYFVSGTDQLWRGVSKGPYLIGSDYENSDNGFIAWLVEGACPKNQTWAYWANIPTIHACSDENGCVNTGDLSSPIHYWSC